LTENPQPLLVHYGIAQRPHALHGDLNHISRHHWAYSFRRSSGNQIAREKSHDLRNVPDDYIQREDKVSRIARLPHRAIDPRLHPNAGPVTSTVRQGYIETSNTSVVREMANMMTAMRMFEANQHVIQIQDDRLGKVISELGGTS